MHKIEKTITMNHTIAFRLFCSCSKQEISRGQRLGTIACFVFLCHMFSLPIFGQTFNEKLDANFDRYDEAKRALSINHNNGLTTSREELNAVLFPGARYLLNKDDLTRLAKRHSLIISSSKEKKDKESMFDLRQLRHDVQTLERFIFELPKGAMLHNHPKGFCNLKTIRAIFERVNPTIHIKKDMIGRVNTKSSRLYQNEIDILNQFPDPCTFSLCSEYQKNFLVNLFVLPQNGKSHPFSRFNAIFKLVELLQEKLDQDTLKWLMALTYEDFIRRASENNVSYVEFTKRFDYSSNIDQFEQLAEKWEKKYNIFARWNFAFSRLEQNKSNFIRLKTFILNFLKRPSPVVVGIDLYANEVDASALDKGQSLYLEVLAHNRSGKMLLHRTMHAGEFGHLHNCRDAVLLRVDRIGHGVKLLSDSLTLEYVRRKEIPIVTNLSSNLQLGGVKNIESHPFLSYLRLGIPVSFSTDDEGILHTNISHELFLVVKYTDINYAELKQISYNGINSCFATEEVKKHRIADLNRRFSAFEEKWSRILCSHPE